jgi:MgtC family
MEVEQLVSRIALALGIGLLIGLERGWRTREAESGSRAAGIRTFAISGLLGGIVGAIAQIVGVTSAGGGIVFAGGLAVYSAVIAAFSKEENRAAGIFSATTAIAGMLTFSLGTYAMVGDVRIAAGAAVVAAAILALREELHGWVARISWPELRSGLVLLAMTFIALPIVPNDPIGPFGGVNPREVWIIAIALACVSFTGYAAVKISWGKPRRALCSRFGRARFFDSSYCCTRAPRGSRRGLAAPSGSRRFGRHGDFLSEGIRNCSRDAAKAPPADGTNIGGSRSCGDWLRLVFGVSEGA